MLSRIGTPPVAFEIAAPVKLFLIDPVEPPVENLARAVIGQGAFALRRYVYDIDVVAAREADHATVGAELFANLFIGITGQSHGFVAVEFIIEEIVGVID